MKHPQNNVSRSIFPLYGRDASRSPRNRPSVTLQSTVRCILTYRSIVIKPTAPFPPNRPLHCRQPTAPLSSVGRDSSRPNPQPVHSQPDTNPLRESKISPQLPLSSPPCDSRESFVKKSRHSPSPRFPAFSILNYLALC